ncbi:hypothetical protein KI387_039016, partial [Taxus chinensis]
MSNAWLLKGRFAATYPTACRNIVFFQRNYARKFSKGNNHSSDIKENLEPDAKQVDNNTDNASTKEVSQMFSPTAAKTANGPKGP